MIIDTKVFTDDWLQQTRSRYERLPEYQRPSIYFLAATENGRIVRDLIEAWVLDLPSHSRERIAPRLRAERNYQDTYHDLLVGSLIKQHGYQIDYEKQLAGLTPDWYVHSRPDVPPFIVEVFTDDISITQRARQAKLDDLRGRLSEIPVGVAIAVQTDRDLTLNAKHNKLIAHEISDWLMNSSPPIGSWVQLDKVSVEVLRYNPSYRVVNPLLFDGAFMVDREPLRRKIKQKVDRYKHIASEMNLSLIVAIVPKIMTGRGLDTLADVLFGSEAISYLYDENSGTIAQPELVRNNDGLLLDLRDLSAIIWIESSAFGQWGIKVAHNPNALRPLPANAFELGGS